MTKIIQSALCQKNIWFYCWNKKIYSYIIVIVYCDKMNMDIKMQKILIYSIDESITPSELRKADDFSDFFENLDTQHSAEKLQNWISQHNIIWLLDDDPDFPYQFRSIKNPPAIMYAMWNLDLLHSHTLWIVWPREMSQYANQVMQTLFAQISGSNIVTVSWMARGVDHLCHQLSIAYHLPTIAILGWWLRYYRNSSARSFMYEIIQNGWLILSEFKLDFKPTPWSFPQRNRLIAGLSDTLFLPEARKGSWSLITADFAYHQHKPIFVAPNQLFSENGIWSNHLVTSWKASLLSDFDQILQFFWIQQRNDNGQMQISTSLSSLSDEDRSLLRIVSQHRDEDFSLRMSEIATDFGEAMVKMTDLEMQGYVRQDVPGIYSVSVKI